MEEDEMTYGIDRLAELLAERGIEFCVGDRTSLVFMDGVGNLHECWMAGAEENLVNVCITITPEQALSVRDLNGIISENAKLRESVTQLRDDWESERDYADQMEAKEKRAVSENAKLRELLRNALTYIEYEGCGVECPETGHGTTLTPCDICNRYETESCAYVIEQDARDLRIEVES